MELNELDSKDLEQPFLAGTEALPGRNLSPLTPKVKLLQCCIFMSPRVNTVAMYFVFFLVWFLLTASALRLIYHDSIDGSDILARDDGTVGVPAVYFRNKKNILLRHDDLSIGFGLSNVPCKLVEDKRVRIGLWACVLSNSMCVDDGSFDILSSFIFDATIDNATQQIGLFQSVGYNFTFSFEGSCRLRLVLDIIDRKHPHRQKPSSAISQFMDEITVTRSMSDKPMVDVWWNDKAQKSFTFDDSLGKEYFRLMQIALNNAFLNVSTLSEFEMKLHGMSGSQFRHFYNNLGALIPSVHYLEIGIFAGSTMVSMLANNGANVRTVVGIDYWDDKEVLGDLFEGGMTTVKGTFDALLPRYTNSNQSIHIKHADCFTVSPQLLLDLTGGQRFNIYLFDGPHAAKDHFFALVNYFPALADTFILIVDDWNWEMVRSGTELGMTALEDQMAVLGKIEIFTGENPNVEASLWHNGMAAFVIQKRLVLSVDVSAV